MARVKVSMGIVVIPQTVRALAVIIRPSHPMHVHLVDFQVLKG
ncbi:hypothetical protein ACFV2Q_19410 [Streptomyces sp. NPDC059650]